MGWLAKKYQIIRKRVISLTKQNREIHHTSVMASINRIYWSAPFMVAGSIIIALTFSQKSEIPYSVEEQWRNRIILAHLLTTLITTVIWLIAGYLRKTEKHPRTQAVFLYLVAIYVLFIGNWITFIDLLVTTRITPFLLTSVMVGVLYYLRPSISLVLYLANFLAFHALTMYYAGEDIILLDSILSNALVVGALGFSLSILGWRSFRTNKLQQKQIDEQRDCLERMAYQDPLTHLPNRRLLDELIRRELHLVRRGEINSCLIVIDLDSFKLVNDRHGHPAGDAVLQQFAHLLQKNMRGSNTLVRLGGEEFVILSSNTTVDEALILAERLREMVATHDFSAGGEIIKITASFGVAPLLGTENLEDYYSVADQALYRAKEQGKNQVAI